VATDVTVELILEEVFRIYSDKVDSSRTFSPGVAVDYAAGLDDRAKKTFWRAFEHALNTTPSTLSTYYVMKKEDKLLGAFNGVSAERMEKAGMPDVMRLTILLAIERDRNYNLSCSLYEK
jgi:hypothetical protein